MYVKNLYEHMAAVMSGRREVRSRQERRTLFTLIQRNKTDACSPERLKGFPRVSCTAS